MDNIKKLQELIDKSDNIVFFGGAGVSTLSGIKDFRSQDGLYNINYKYPPEEILSRTFFNNNTEEFYKFYRDKLNCLENKPNIVHKYLALLEKKGKLKGVITQNIDGLHQKAGSKKVFELHGSIYRNKCISCLKDYDADYVFNNSDVPKCSCGGVVKPCVVLYEEALDYDVMKRSIDLISSCDLLIVGGTSLTVYPASSFINYFKGSNLVIINNMVTDFDKRADLLIHKDLGEVFKNLK